MAFIYNIIYHNIRYIFITLAKSLEFSHRLNESMIYGPSTTVDQLDY